MGGLGAHPLARTAAYVPAAWPLGKAAAVADAAEAAGAAGGAGGAGGAGAAGAADAPPPPLTQEKLA